MKNSRYRMFATMLFSMFLLISISSNAQRPGPVVVHTTVVTAGPHPIHHRHHHRHHKVVRRTVVVRHRP